MKRLAVFCVLLAALVGVSGCASDSPDGLVKQQIALMNEEAEAHENKAPASTLAAIKAKQDVVQKKWDALKLSNEEKKKLVEQHKDAIQKAANRLLAAT